MNLNPTICPICKVNSLKLSSSGKIISKSCTKCANSKIYQSSKKKLAERVLLFCLYCGDEFLTAYKDQRYCSSLCQRKLQNEKSNASFIKGRVHPNSKTSSFCNTPISTKWKIDQD